MGRGAGRREVLSSRSDAGLSTDERVALAKETLDEGLRALSSTAEWERALRAAARFHQYSWSNTLLIHCQRPDATRVAAFGAWLQLGRHVKAGEHGLVILAPRRIAKTRVDPKTGEEEDASFVYFRPAYVFDVGQTEGDPLPEIKHPLEGEGSLEWALDRHLVRALESRGCTVLRDVANAPEEPLVLGARRVEVGAGISRAQSAKLLAHALAHLALDHSEHDARAECEAESAAYIALHIAGLEAGEYSFGFIGEWSRGDTKLLSAAGRNATKAAAVIVDALGFGPAVSAEPAAA